MDPVVVLALRGIVLILLYVFVARAIRAVIRDVRAAPQPAAAPAAPPVKGDRKQGRRKDRKPRPKPSELVVHVPGARPRVVRLDGGEVTFGRAETSTVMLTDPYVSERHARVYRDGGEWLVADMGSTNGTLLNRAKVTRPTPLAAGDQIGIGKVTVEARR
jgi:pSer/pThr/pTyr-binding forkhead associated (FHA) protein